MRIRSLAGAAVLFAGLGVSAAAADKPEDQAQAAAEAWLKLADQGDAGATWDQAAKRFQAAVTKDQWKQAFASARSPLGTIVSRKLLSRQYAENMPGAPDGKYVTIQYETVFEKKAAAVETITPLLDSDGSWRVAGYFIR